MKIAPKQFIDKHWKTTACLVVWYLTVCISSLAQTVNSHIADFFLFSGESTELIIEIDGSPEQFRNSFITAIGVNCEGKVLFEDTSIPITDEMLEGGRPIIITLPVKALINVFWAEYWIEVKWYPKEPDKGSEAERITQLYPEEDSLINVEIECELVKTESSTPAIEGGLLPGKQSFKISRDDYIPLLAKASDFDRITISCIPDDDCDDLEKGTRKEYLLPGPLTYQWEIQGKGNKGSFKEVGFLPENVFKTTGEQVIYEPPQHMPIYRGFAEDPTTQKMMQKAKDTTHVDKVILRIEDAADKLKDEALIRTITISTTRKVSDADHYYVEVQSADFNLLGPVFHGDTFSSDENYCRYAVSCSETNSMLPSPSIKKSEVDRADWMAYKEWRILKVAPIVRTDNLHTGPDKTKNPLIDKDKITFHCNSTFCESSSVSETYNDLLEYTWTIEKGGGRFVKSNKGSSVIFEAPDFGSEVTISVYASNPLGLCPEMRSGKTKIIIQVGEPAIELAKADRKWRPKYNVPLDVTASFKIRWRDVNHWQPAPKHIGKRVKYKLAKVSSQPGIACNFDEPWALEGNRIDIHIDHSANYKTYELSEESGPTERVLEEGVAIDFYWTKAISHRKIEDQAPVRLTCMDWGGYAALTATTIDNTYKVLQEDAGYNIPLDLTDHFIADVFETYY